MNPLTMREVNVRCHECGTLEIKENGIVIEGVRYAWDGHDAWFCNMEHKEIWLERNHQKIQDGKKSNV